MADTKIRFQVEGMDSIHSGLEQLKRDAESLSSVFETHNATITSQLKEQLQLLKERNSLLNPKSSTPLTPTIAPPSISTDANGEQGLILKDLAARVDHLITILTNQGIRINDETISRLGGGMGPQPQGSSISRGVSRGLFWNSMGAVNNAIYQGFVGSIWAPNSVAQDIMLRKNTGNLLQTLGGTALLLPSPWAKIGGGLVMGVGNAVNYFAEKDDRTNQIFTNSSNQRALLGSLYNLPPQAWAFDLSRQFGGAAFGFTQDIALEKLGAYTMAGGRRLSPHSGAEFFALERALPLTQSDIANAARSMRTAGGSVPGTVSNLFDTLVTNGVSESWLRINISDFLKTLVGLNQAQVDRLGSVNGRQEDSINFIAKLASVIPRRLEQIEKISTSLDNPINPANPYQSALLYSSIRNAYGDTSLWQVERIKNEGLVQHPELLQSLFDTASSWSGGNADLTKLILHKDLLSQFGLTPHDIDALYKVYQTEGGFASKLNIDVQDVNTISAQGLKTMGVHQTPVELIDAATKELKDLWAGTALDSTVLLEYSSSLEQAGSVIQESVGNFVRALEDLKTWYFPYSMRDYNQPIGSVPYSQRP